MSRNDGINRTVVRNRNLTAKQINNAQRHNEREKEIYTNPDIVPERAAYNVHFKESTGSYNEMLTQMIASGAVSTRGLKDDAKLYGELIFDVNSAYFYNHGGYDFAKRFYEDAYKAAIQIVGGEQYILSAVMHADERNSAMSEALGQDVYHYHLHVVYIPVVEKQILWTKRCKDKSLVGTVKETVMQVSSSKKWQSKPAVDEQGQTILQKNGKPVLKKSYSVLQDDFWNAMRKAGYTDVERGEHGSTEEHLTVTQFKVEQEQAHLQQLEAQTQKKENRLKEIEQQTTVQKKVALSFDEIDRMGRKTFTGKLELTQQEGEQIKRLAKKGVKANATIADLKQRCDDAEREAAAWKQRYMQKAAQTQIFTDAMRQDPERTQALLRQVAWPKHVKSRATVDRVYERRQDAGAR